MKNLWILSFLVASFSMQAPEDTFYEDLISKVEQQNTNSGVANRIILGESSTDSQVIQAIDNAAVTDINKVADFLDKASSANQRRTLALVHYVNLVNQNKTDEAEGIAKDFGIPLKVQEQLRTIDPYNNIHAKILAAARVLAGQGEGQTAIQRTANKLPGFAEALNKKSKVFNAYISENFPQQPKTKAARPKSPRKTPRPITPPQSAAKQQQEETPVVPFPSPRLKSGASSPTSASDEGMLTPRSASSRNSEETDTSPLTSRSPSPSSATSHSQGATVLKLPRVPSSMVAAYANSQFVDVVPASSLARKKSMTHSSVRSHKSDAGSDSSLPGQVVTPRSSSSSSPFSDDDAQSHTSASSTTSAHPPRTRHFGKSSLAIQRTRS